MKPVVSPSNPPYSHAEPRFRPRASISSRRDLADRQPPRFRARLLNPYPGGRTIWQLACARVGASAAIATTSSQRTARSPKPDSTKASSGPDNAARGGHCRARPFAARKVDPGILEAWLMAGRSRGDDRAEDGSSSLTSAGLVPEPGPQPIFRLEGGVRTRTSAAPWRRNSHQRVCHHCPP